ncbi:MAG: hypothetical protein A2046_13565 [Bacteroidetes bacterium GWA2_30_7]|nr:MAG: hypothetical protein A2046_13565 [Bacteroidetes bacterium GWA2_30_7]
MKKLLFIHLALCFVVLSCKKDDNTNPQSIITNASMIAKIDGTSWNSVTRVTIQKSGIFLITGTSVDGKLIEITVKGTTIGTYNLLASMDSAAAQCGSIYKPSINNNDSTYASKSGQVKISSIDTENKLISGTFNFVVTNLEITKNITDGKFTDLKYQIQ